MYNPRDHYWAVGGSTDEVWASQRTAYVPADDATYAAWAASGGRATSILNLPELVDVLGEQWLPAWIAQGVTVTSTLTPALDGAYPLDGDAIREIDATMTGINAGHGLPGGGPTFNWPDADGTPHAFSAADFTNFAVQARDFYYGAKQALPALLNKVDGAAMPSRNVEIA